jgi:polar amino acid transport system substrate-binding protein
MKSVNTKSVLYTAITLTAAAAMAGALLAGCGKKDTPADDPQPPSSAKAQETRSFRAADFSDKTFAILSGSSFDAVARDAIGAQSRKYYNTQTEAAEAVTKGEADAMLVEEPVGRKIAAQNEELAMLYPPVDVENYAAIFPKKDGGKLRDEYNSFLVKIRSSGVYEDMIKRWMDTPASPPMPEIALPPAPDKTLTFATSDGDEPFSYKSEKGEIVGFDVELALRFAQDGGYGLEMKIMTFPDIIPSVKNGKADFASNLITITEDRKTFIDFSEPVYYGGTVVIVKR